MNSGTFVFWRGQFYVISGSTVWMLLRQSLMGWYPNSAQDTCYCCIYIIALRTSIMAENGSKEEQEYLLVLTYEEPQLAADIPTHTHLFVYLFIYLLYPTIHPFKTQV
jgi:hypothetical protein